MDCIEEGKEIPVPPGNDFRVGAVVDRILEHLGGLVNRRRIGILRQGVLWQTGRVCASYVLAAHGSELALQIVTDRRSNNGSLS